VGAGYAIGDGGIFLQLSRSPSQPSGLWHLREADVVAFGRAAGGSTASGTLRNRATDPPRSRATECRTTPTGSNWSQLLREWAPMFADHWPRSRDATYNTCMSHWPVGSLDEIGRCSSIDIFMRADSVSREEELPPHFLLSLFSPPTPDFLRTVQCGAAKTNATPAGHLQIVRGLPPDSLCFCLAPHLARAWDDGARRADGYLDGVTYSGGWVAGPRHPW